MTRITHIIGALALAAACRAQVPFAWRAESSAAAPAVKDVYRGETVALAPAYTADGAALATNGWAFTAWWSTNGAQWWSKGPEADPAHTLRGDPFLWTPEMDCGARSYQLFIRAVAPGGTSYRANALVRMMESPGAAPNALALPVPGLDFAGLRLTNAPWLVSAAWLAGSNALAGLVSAATGEQARAGALLATQIVEGAIAALQTNRVTRLQAEDGGRWIDGTGGVWRVETVVTSTVLRIVFSDDFRSATGGAPPQRYYDWAYGFTDGGWQGSSTLGAHTVDDGTGASWRGGWPSVEPEVLYPSTLAPDSADAQGTAVLGYVDLGYAVTSRVDGVVFESSLAWATPAPTNAAAGWLLYDAGSNVWLSVTVSNLSFTVWEVQ